MKTRDVPATPTFGSLRAAFRMGVQDGRESPDELTTGMTWDEDDRLNEAYDRGVNEGQRRGR
jgi:hypothetical protein